MQSVTAYCNDKVIGCIQCETKAIKLFPEIVYGELTRGECYDITIDGWCSADGYKYFDMDRTSLMGIRFLLEKTVKEE